MKKSKRDKIIYYCKRILIYILGLLIYAYSVCLITRADIGISPITSIAYIFTFFTPYTLGMTQFVVNIILILIQVIWLRKEFKKYQYLQIAASFIFSVFIDVLMPLTVMFDPGVMSLISRILLFMVSLVIMGLGLSIVTISDIIMLPGDGVAKTIAYKLDLEFGKAKVFNDVACITATCIISFIALQRLESVQIGTVISALFLGNIVRYIMKYIRMPLQTIIDCETG